MNRLRTRYISITLIALSAAWAGTSNALDLDDTSRWRRARSTHYEVHTDLERDLAEDLHKRLEAMYREYSNRLIDFQRTGREKPVYQVYLFDKKADYNRLTGDRYRNTGGIYMSHRKILAAFLEGQGRDSLRRTLQHEAFHQFALTTIHEELPVWLNEGMAEYFAEGIWTGNGFMVGQVPPRRLRQLQQDLRDQKLIRFRKILGMSLDEWNESLHGDAEVGAVQYNQAWAMVHFLVHGSNGEDRYRVRLTRMLKLLHGGTPGDEAFRQAFSGNIEGFQSRFIEYARALKPTPEATLIERQDVLADMLTAMYVDEGKRFKSIDEFRRVVLDGRLRLRYSKGNVDWQTETDPRIYFTDIAGNALDRNALYLESRPDSPLPDLVCRTGNMRLRTRFYKLGDDIDHEILTFD